MGIGAVEASLKVTSSLILFLISFHPHVKLRVYKMFKDHLMI